nr:hypothetical protein CR513_46425 [Ipomoea batatas]
MTFFKRRGCGLGEKKGGEGRGGRVNRMPSTTAFWHWEEGKEGIKRQLAKSSQELMDEDWETLPAVCKRLQQAMCSCHKTLVHKYNLLPTVTIEATKPAKVENEAKPQRANPKAITFRPFISSPKNMTERNGTIGVPNLITILENKEETLNVKAMAPNVAHSPVTTSPTSVTKVATRDWKIVISITSFRLSLLMTFSNASCVRENKRAGKAEAARVNRIPTRTTPSTMYIEARTTRDRGFLASGSGVLGDEMTRNGTRIGNPAVCKAATSHLLFPPWS